MDLRTPCLNFKYDELPIAEAEASVKEEKDDETDAKKNGKGERETKSNIQRMALISRLDEKGSTGLLDWQIEADSKLVECYCVKKKQKMMCAMLNDKARNSAYADAIRRAVKGFKAEKKQTPLVLDIGTGTGFLAMLAAEEGAEVIACEMNSDIANVAKRVVKKNNLSDRIRILPKRSTELRLETDLNRRADIIVTETLDSQLLNEGILASLSHAKRHLSSPNVITIPRAATVYIHLCDNPTNSLKLNCLNTTRIHMCDDASIKGLPQETKDNDTGANFSCVNSSICIHENALDGLKILSDDIPVFKCDFSGKSFGPTKDKKEAINVKATREGNCRFAVMWWRLELDDTITLETRAVSQSDSTWQDHWFRKCYIKARF